MKIFFNNQWLEYNYNELHDDYGITNTPSESVSYYDSSMQTVNGWKNNGVVWIIQDSQWYSSPPYWNRTYSLVNRYRIDSLQTFNIYEKQSTEFVWIEVDGVGSFVTLAQLHDNYGYSVTKSSAWNMDSGVAWSWYNETENQYFDDRVGKKLWLDQPPKVSSGNVFGFFQIGELEELEQNFGDLILDEGEFEPTEIENTVVYDSTTGEGCSALKIVKLDVSYYFVLDGIQADWTDDLESIGYQITPPAPANTLYYATAAGTRIPYDTYTPQQLLYSDSELTMQAEYDRYKKYILTKAIREDGSESDLGDFESILHIAESSEYSGKARIYQTSQTGQGYSIGSWIGFKFTTEDVTELVAYSKQDATSMNTWYDLYSDVSTTTLIDASIYKSVSKLMLSYRNPTTGEITDLPSHVQYLSLRINGTKLQFTTGGAAINLPTGCKFMVKYAAEEKPTIKLYFKSNKSNLSEIRSGYWYALYREDGQKATSSTDPAIEYMGVCKLYTSDGIFVTNGNASDGYGEWCGGQSSGNIVTAAYIVIPIG